MIDKYFIQKTVKTESLSEFDFILYGNLFGKEWDDDDLVHPSERIIDNREFFSDGTPIEIDVLIRLLQKLKRKGANYIALNDHCDHHGYDIEGIKIEEATKKEIENYLAKKKESKEKEDKIKELYNQIKEIQK